MGAAWVEMVRASTARQDREVHPDDQRQITAAMDRFETTQKRTNVYLKTLPSDQPFGG